MAENPEVLDLSHIKPDPVALAHAGHRDNGTDDAEDGAP